MPDPITSRKLEPRLRAELEIATAVARERVLDVHVARALALVEGAKGQIPPLRALGIYARLHRLGASEAKIIGSRVLAALGERAGATSPGRGPADDPANAWDSPLSIFALIRRRLRGRVNRELRRWVEIQTGRTEVALLRVHVENALRFIAILLPGTAIAEAVDTYADLLGVRRPLAEVVYFFALDQLAEPDNLNHDHCAPRPEPAPAGGQVLRIVNEQR